MATRREIQQLLKDYRAFHSPHGGAFATEDSHLRTAAYGPAGLIESGMEYSPQVRAALEKSYTKLGYAVTLLNRRPDMMFAYLLLRPVYFGDPADPSIAALWREASDYRTTHHDAYVEGLWDLLKDHEMFVVWPQRMPRSEERLVEKRNDEFYAEYVQVKTEKLNEGLKGRRANRQAIEIAATRHGYGESRAYEIVRIRGLAAVGA
jgi:hypothetical protein